MAILPWRAPRMLRNGHLHRDTVRARSAMAINQAERSAISQLERQQRGVRSFVSSPSRFHASAFRARTVRAPDPVTGRAAPPARAA